MDNVILIDGDIVAYKASSSSEQVIDWGDTVSLECDLPKAMKSVDAFVEAMQKKFAAKRTIICLSDDTDNFRKHLYADYKGNRDGRRKPIALGKIKKLIAEKYETKWKPGLEADDVLGILASHPTLIPGKRIVITTDKDLLQIPGRNYNPDKDEKMIITEASGFREFMYQSLIGDSTDNYPGCPGIGKKRGTFIMATLPKGETPEERKTMWDAVVAAYEKASKKLDDAILMARVARILTHTDYDFTNKKPILWTPTF